MSQRKRKPRHISQQDWDAVDSPPLTDAEMRRMRPASEVIPEIVEAYRRTRGRPPKAQTKVPVTIRLDAQIVRAFRATGRGWQTRINDILARWLRRRAG